MTREVVVQRLSKGDGRLLQNMRQAMARLQDEGDYQDRVLQDIIFCRTEEGLEIKYIFL